MNATTITIPEDSTLVGATYKSGYSIPVYDDGFGKLYIHRHSIGISGIVRAQSWEDAYSICEDEFFLEADDEAFEKHYDDMTDHERACWDEAYGYRPNGANVNDKLGHGVYAKDLNGDQLDELTEELAKRLEITLKWEAI